MPDKLRRLRAVDLAITAATLISLAYLGWAIITPRPAIPSAPPSATIKPVPAEPLNLSGAPVQGNSSAKVVIIEFSDFQCPYCRLFATGVLPDLRRLYIETGRVALAFRHFPLESIHPLAVRAAQLSVCAANEGHFWEMHDLLYQQARLEERTLELLPWRLGLRRPSSACLAEQTLLSIQRDVTEAKRLGIESTPSFLVGAAIGDGRVRIRQRISGASPLATFVAAIEPLLR
jgi:protein-disulfide isomerase